MSRFVDEIARVGANGATTVARAGAPPLWALPLLGGVLQSLAQVYCVTEQERTRRAGIEAELSIRREGLSLVRDALAAQLACWIEERRAMFNGLLLRLDAAVASRDVTTAAALLDAIVDLARANPLAERTEPTSATVTSWPSLGSVHPGEDASTGR